MYTSYDEYLRITEDPFANNEPTAPRERCPYCGDSHPPHQFGSWNGQRMCLDCVAAEQLEAHRDALARRQLSPRYEELMNQLAEAYQVSRS